MFGIRKYEKLFDVVKFFVTQNFDENLIKILSLCPESNECSYRIKYIPEFIGGVILRSNSRLAIFKMMSAIIVYIAGSR